MIDDWEYGPIYYDDSSVAMYCPKPDAGQVIPDYEPASLCAEIQADHIRHHLGMETRVVEAIEAAWWVNR